MNNFEHQTDPVDLKAQEVLQDLQEKIEKVISDQIALKSQTVLLQLQQETEKVIAEYLKYTGVDQKDLDGAFPSSDTEQLVYAPVTSLRTNLVQVGSFFYAAMLSFFIQKHRFVGNDMPVEDMVEWAKCYGYLRSTLNAAVQSGESSSSGGKQRAQIYQSRFSALRNKCDELFPGWLKNKRPSADEMAEEMIGMFDISHRRMADEIREARKMHRAVHSAQDTEHDE